MDNRYSEIRKQVFSTPISLDLQLIEIIEDFDSHKFLKNPAGQNIHLYLTLFVKTLAEQYFLKPIQDLAILDWGCGKGHVTYLLNKLGGKPTSCDIDADATDSSFGQETPILDKTDISVVRLTHESDLPFKQDSMDIVLSFGVLEHVVNDLESLKELNRILKSEGLLFCFNLPYQFSWTQNLAHARVNYYHDRLYSKHQVGQLLKHTGFKLLDLWHRQLSPKNGVTYPNYRFFESVDQFLPNRPL
ncbi:MAG: class I SAM-dependent methyltransferase [Cyanobacteria bacterium P01_F01_bin.86]